MADDDLAVRVRDYARDRLEKRLFTDGTPVVSSAWLAREFDVDPRTIAAALRPYGVKPGEVERGVRGYSVAVLAGLDLADDVKDARPVLRPPPVSDGVTGGASASVGFAEAPPAGSALDLLSAGAGHDMTPALRAAGLL